MRHLSLIFAATLVFGVFSPTFGEWFLSGNRPGTAVPASPGSPITDPQGVAVRNIPPLYVEPKLPGEGIWVKDDLSAGHDDVALVYRTVYRPSELYPNAVVYMVLFNMKHISARLYLGSGEPYRKESAARVEEGDQPRLLAITNALWQTRHSGPGGIVFRGQVLKEMAPGVATIVGYQDDSIDILEWNAAIPLSEVRDARQLHHLIVKDGKVVTTLTKRGRVLSAEIGLGSLLNEERPIVTVPGAAPGDKPSQKMNFTSGELWFLANRSAFGIRPDGNLVFAVGHHVSTGDLAKALVLAGCVRAIHGDANPGNCVGILYFKDRAGEVVKKVALSPSQDRSTLDRYLKGNYPKDFFAFFRRPTEAH